MREEARSAKDFATVDRIREWLGQLDIVIADTKDGSTWKMS
ncbi:MAG: hypothetical protein ACE5H4_10560 [Candidatus Thorarchaeota archaeon]